MRSLLTTTRAKEERKEEEEGKCSEQEDAGDKALVNTQDLQQSICTIRD